MWLEVIGLIFLIVIKLFNTYIFVGYIRREKSRFVFMNSLFREDLENKIGVYKVMRMLGVWYFGL